MKLLKRGSHEILIPDVKYVKYYDILGEHTKMKEFVQNFYLNNPQYSEIRKK